ncbi:hypothetical protein FRC10_010414, partial [Ceratobasidium sp. 414]
LSSEVCDTVKSTPQARATDQAAKHSRIESSHSKEANANQVAIDKARAEKQRKKQARQQQLDEEEEEDLRVEYEDETKCEAQLRALSSDLQKELNRTRALLLKKCGDAKGEPDPIPQPWAMTGFAVSKFHELIGLSKDRNDTDVHHRWLAILSAIRDFMIKAGLDWESALSGQDPGKYGRVASVLYNLIPEIQPCVNNWGAEFLLKSGFKHRRGHLQHKEKVRREAKRKQPAKPKAAGKAKKPEPKPVRRAKGREVIQDNNNEGEVVEKVVGKLVGKGVGKTVEKVLGKMAETGVGKVLGKAAGKETVRDGSGGTFARVDSNNCDDVESTPMTLAKLASMSAQMSELDVAKAKVLARSAAAQKEREAFRAAASSSAAKLKELKERQQARKARSPVPVEEEEEEEEEEGDKGDKGEHDRDEDEHEGWGWGKGRSEAKDDSRDKDAAHTRSKKSQGGLKGSRLVPSKALADLRASLWAKNPELAAQVKAEISKELGDKSDEELPETLEIQQARKWLAVKRQAQGDGGLAAMKASKQALPLDDQEGGGDAKKQKTELRKEVAADRDRDSERKQHPAQPNPANVKVMARASAAKKQAANNTGSAPASMSVVLRCSVSDILTRPPPKDALTRAPPSPPSRLPSKAVLTCPPSRLSSQSTLTCAPPSHSSHPPPESALVCVSNGVQPIPLPEDAPAQQPPTLLLTEDSMRSADKTAADRIPRHLSSKVDKGKPTAGKAPNVGGSRGRHRETIVTLIHMLQSITKGNNSQ